MTLYKSILLASLATFAVSHTAYAAEDAKPEAAKDAAPVAKKAVKKVAKKVAAPAAVAVAVAEVKPVVAKNSDIIVRSSDGTQSLKISGFIKGEGSYDMEQFGGDTAFIPLAKYENLGLDSGKKNIANMHAKVSRLKFTTEHDTSIGHVTGALTFDNFSDKSDVDGTPSTSHSPRMRHAFMKLNGWTIGYTTTNFNDGMPTSFVDFNGLLDTARQALVNYTHKFGNGFSATVGLEAPSTDLTLSYNGDTAYSGKSIQGGSHDGNGGNGGTAGDFRNLHTKEATPDVTARLQYDFGNGHSVNLRGVFRRLSVDVEEAKATPAANSFDKKNYRTNAYGLGVSGHFNVMNWGQLSAQFHYGNGMGRYIGTAGGMGAVYNPFQRVLDAQKLFNMMVGYNQKITEKLSANVGYSYTNLTKSENLFKNDATRDMQTSLGGGHANEIGASISNGQVPTKSTTQMFANFMYNPTKPVTLGVEYTYQVKKTFSDSTFVERKAKISRVGVAAWYRF